MGSVEGIPEEVVCELRPKQWAEVSQVKERGKRCTEQPVQRRGGLGRQGVLRGLRSSVWLELGPLGEELARDEGPGGGD